MNFRVAHLRDALFVANSLKQFYKRDGGVYQIGYDHSSCLETTLDILQNGIVVVGPASCAGAYIHPWPFNFSINVAQVLFWCFSNSKEIGVFDYLLEICQQRGATHINVASLAPKHSGKQFYRKRQLRISEIQYLGLCKPTAKR